MNREAISKTAVCYWSDEDDCYVVSSMIFHVCAGIGDTPEEAWTLFKYFLNETYIDYKEGRLAGYDKAGRPSKGGLGIHVRVQPTTKEDIDKLAKKFGISQGEVIDYLVNFHEIAVLPEKPAATKQGKARSTKTNGAKPVPIMKARNITRQRNKHVRQAGKARKAR